MAAGGNRNLCLLCLHEIDRDAPCEEDGTCENCRDDLNAKFYMTSYAYYKAIIGEALLRELDKNKNGNAYISRSAVTVKVHNVPLDFMKQFMEDVRKEGRDNAEPWDREGPRVLVKASKTQYVWLLTTARAVRTVCQFGTKGALIPADQAAFGDTRQFPKGDLIKWLPPMMLTWDKHPIDDDVWGCVLTLKAPTALLSCNRHTTLSFTPHHPVDTTSEGSSLRRWPHLPFYDNWEVYNLFEFRRYLKTCQSKLVATGKAEILAAISNPAWGAPNPPCLVDSRVPGEEFQVTDRSPLPYQHPLLKSAGWIKTLYEVKQREQVDALQQSKQQEEEDSYTRSMAAWERRAYLDGKEMTSRVNNTAERREANYRRYGWSMDLDPRFNGMHEAQGYEGVGPDPCDPNNRRSWLLNCTVPKPQRKTGRKRGRGSGT